jgi:hypothetical protein
VKWGLVKDGSDVTGRPVPCPDANSQIMRAGLFIFVVLELELGLYLEPLHQPFFVKGFFQDGVS